MLYDLVEEEWSHSDARGRLLTELAQLVDDARASKDQERERVDERRASFQRLFKRDAPDSQSGERRRNTNVFKNIMRKIKGKSEKETQQERLQLARAEMLSILDGVKTR